MGKTYSHIPIALPDIFRPIVAKVSDNLASESSLNIDQVTFMHGTWMDISNELQEWSKAKSKKQIKFPLVCLLYKADEKFVDTYSDEITVDILICTDTMPTYSNDDRYAINFKPILYPIYAELKSVIGSSSSFWGYNRNFEHTKIDLPHAGQESGIGPTAYDLQDVIDGVMMKGVKLKVALGKCDYIPPNLCLLTPCPYGLENYYKTVFKNVTFSGVATGTITASVNAWDHFDNTVPMALPTPWQPEIDWRGDGTWVPMTAGATPVDPWTASKNVIDIAGGDGWYKGMIRNGDAYVEFYYRKVAGSAVKMTTRIEQSIEVAIDCESYPAYPATVTGLMVVTGIDEQPILNGYELRIFGVQKVNESFDPTEIITKETATTTTHGDSISTIINNFRFVGGQLPISCVSIFKTRCKNSFD